jgi:hypothetical protein
MDRPAMVAGAVAGIAPRREVGREVRLGGAGSLCTRPSGHDRVLPWRARP